MRVLLAPNAFKGTLGPLAAAKAMAAAARARGHKAELLPISDGGDGLIEALKFRCGGTMRGCSASDALGRKLRAEFLLLKGGRVAVLEMARASGLAALRGARNKPLEASSYGTGQLIKAALDCGASKIIVGLGGSACNDAGTGMAVALGARFYDAAGRVLPRGAGPLAALAGIDFSGLDPRLEKTEIVAFGDVRNPLLGRYGSARVYGPQKGATPAQVRLMEKSLARLCAVLKRQRGLSVGRIPGGAAAGGVAAGLVVFCGAKLACGAEEVLKLLGARDMVSKADLVMTGEGKLDSQTLFGKAPAVLAGLCRKRGKPLIFVCAENSLSARRMRGAGIGRAVSFRELGASRAQSVKDPRKWIYRSALAALDDAAEGRACL